MLGATNIRVMRGPASFHYLQVSNNPVSIPASEGWSNALIYPSRITICILLNIEDGCFGIFSVNVGNIISNINLVLTYLVTQSYV